MIIAIRIYQKALAAVARGESLTKASKDYSISSSNTASPQRWKCSETRSLINHTEQQLAYVTIIMQTYPMERWMHGLCVKDVGLRRLAFEIAETYALKHPFNCITKLGGKASMKG